MFENVGDYITEKIRERSREQGHTLTGKFEAGLGYVIQRTPEKVSIIGTDEAGVAKFLDVYTPPGRIPFSPGSGAGRSRFIDGLTDYAEKRFGLSGKEAVSAAFAMAHTMRREGKSTINAHRYSKTGKRTGVITDVLQENEEAIIGLIKEAVGEMINVQITNLLKKWQ